MSLDLFEDENTAQLHTMRPAALPDVGVFDGFVRGAALTTMQGLAKTGRAIDLLGSVGPIIQDAFTGGTEAQDRYFAEHDEVWGSAVDYWTPKPLEVGAAGQIAGMLISTLPMVIAAPSLAVGSLQLSTAEDLVRKGVDATRANLVGASQAAGLGLGIYMPIFGRTFAERVLYGGIGFNVAQGVGMRAAGQGLLAGTPAEGEFSAFDPTGLTLDVLLGAAFGGIVHLSPAQRAQGAEMWARLEDWGKGVKPSDQAALAALRQAQHLNVDSMPGRPAEPVDVERHAQRVRQALEQLARDEAVDVTDLPAPRFEAEPGRMQEMAARARELTEAAEAVRKAEGFAPPPPRIQIPEMPGLSAEHRAIEARARERVLADIEGHIKAYDKLPDSDGGKILNTDVARELFPEYAASKATRSVYSAAVHEPASAVIKEIFSRRISQPDPNGLDMVSFTAGGTGAGKTSALAAVPLASKIVHASQLVYDTNMANFRSAAEKIDLALSHGKQANIIFVAADPVESFKRALRRAMKIGRTVPLEEHAKTHRGSAATIEQLMRHYQGDQRVQFVFLDNAAGVKGEVDLVEPANAPQLLRSLNFDKLEDRLRETLDAEFKAGRISQEVYRGTAHTFTPGPGEATGPGGRGQPEAGAGAGGQRGAGEAPRLREEVDFAQVPEPGERLLVYRLGNRGGLDNRNGANSAALGLFLQRLDDVDAPQPVGGPGRTISAYEVVSPQGYGDYTTFDQGRGKGGKKKADKPVVPGRRAVGKDGKGGIEYSFPKGAGWEAKPLASVSLDDVRKTLSEISEYKTFDEAGGALAAEAVRRTLASKIESEAPAVTRGEAEPPPPRGPRGGEAAGAEGTAKAPDPAQLEAERFVAEEPDLLLTVGRDHNGDPILMTAREYLDGVVKKADEAAEQVKLFDEAAACLLGVS